MIRREFLRLLGALPFAGLVKGKTEPTFANIPCVQSDKPMQRKAQFPRTPEQFEIQRNSLLEDVPFVESDGPLVYKRQWSPVCRLDGKKPLTAEEKIALGVSDIA